MEVSSRLYTSEQGHVIEVGRATWDESQMSVRSRRPNRNGGFNMKSPEIPIGDLPPIMEVVAGLDLLKADALNRIIEHCRASQARQS